MDALKRHQQKCGQVKIKCPRCHRSVNDIDNHLGLCPIPTCSDCQQQFPDLSQLKEHKKTHKKRKSVMLIDKSTTSNTSNKKRKTEGQFRCGMCEQSFVTRQELFQHKLTHLEDSTVFEPVEPHIDFEDRELVKLL